MRRQEEGRRPDYLDDGRGRMGGSSGRRVSDERDMRTGDRSAIRNENADARSRCEWRFPLGLGGRSEAVASPPLHHPLAAASTHLSSTK